MFDSIKDALNKTQKQPSATKNILTLEKGKTYILRLLPNIEQPDKTWFNYYTFGWKSFSNGSYISTVSPSSFGERDPIAEERIKLYRTGSVDDKEKIKAVRRSEKWLVNVYVVSDPTNPENNGQVRILRYGKQLHTVINSAVAGEDADEFGSKVFDLTSKGVNLKIKVDEQGEFANYSSSRFTGPTDLKLTSEQIATIYSSVFNLNEIFTIRSYDELKEMFDEHFYCKNGGGSERAAPHTESKAFSETPPYAGEPIDTDDDETMKRLLKGLD
jgi:hypothetical protein